MKHEMDFFDLKLSEKIGNMFEYAILHEGFDIYTFTEAWLCSQTFFNIQDWDVALVSQTATYIFAKFMEETKKQSIIIEKKECAEFPECINWIGYITTYWCIKERITGADIIRNYNISKIIDSAFVYHTVGVCTAIDMMKGDWKKGE